MTILWLIKKNSISLKQPINLDLVNINQIVVFDKFKHSDGGFKYFIGYREGEIIKPLCIILPQMNGYIKCFENGGKNMSVLIKDMLDKYNEIWNRIKKAMGIKFHSMPVYDEKYIKAKTREFNCVIKTNFLGDEIPKKGVPFTYIACITVHSFIRMKKNELSTSLFRRMQIQNKEIRMSKFIKTEMQSESESKLESDTKLEPKSELESDSE